jgi:hypothetical protein
MGLESIHYDNANSIYVGITIETRPGGTLNLVEKREFTSTWYMEYTSGDWYGASNGSYSSYGFYRCGHSSSLDSIAIKYLCTKCTPDENYVYYA